MAINQTPLLRTTNLNPAQVEKQKTPQQKAEDVIYTLNHAVTCLSITDTVGIGAAASVVKSITGKKPGWAEHDHGSGGYSPWNWVKDRFTGKYRDWKPPAHDHGHGHDHSHDHDHDHSHDHEHDHAHGEACSGHKHEEKKPAAGAAHDDHHHHDHGPEINPQSSGKDVLKAAWHNAKGWLISEAIGDLGAVPVTMAFQRYTPGFMQSIRNGLEPVIGGTFRKNTERAAISWGMKHGKKASSDEVQEYGHQLYEYEMRHMPQMAVWTVSSVILNFGAMQLLHKINPKEFDHITPKDFMIGKSVGASMTAGLMLTIRGLTPGGAHKWDQTVGKHVILPVTKTVGKAFGVKSSDVDAFEKNREGANAPKTVVTEAKPEQTIVPQQEMAAAV